MSVVIAMALFSLALHLGATVSALAITRAPGWDRVRVVVLLAGTAAIYSLADLIGALHWHAQTGITWTTTVNLTVAAVHASCWLWYTFSDDRASWRSLPAWTRRLAIGNVAISGVLSLTGLAVEPGRLDRVQVPLFGIDYVQPRLTIVATLAAALILATILVSFVAHLQRAWRGVPGSRGVAVGFTVFVLCSVEEGLVAIGALDFIYLAEIGYLALIIPVTANLVQRFLADARRLALLSERLTEEVERAMAERDAARNALAAQERMAALGRIASGVGHEINNPLQFLLLSLEEIREETANSRTPVADASMAHAFEGVDRIRRVVEGLRTYSSPTHARIERVDLREAVQAALRVATPQLGGAPEVRTTLGPVPAIAGDEGKIVQVIVNAVVNASHVLKAQPPNGGSIIRVTTRTAADGQAELEIRDNGPGFPADLLPMLGEPFVTTRAASGGSGLGIFVIRGIVDAHGGTLLLENAPEGGALLRIRFPAAPANMPPGAVYGTTAVASISTTAPGSTSADTSTAVIAG